MIIVCKCNSIPGRLDEKYVNLTIRKNYEALTDFNDSDMMVEIIDDGGEKCWHLKSKFYSLDVYRDNKLKEIGL